jgi:putative tricarboxylic transport membrane protein
MDSLASLADGFLIALTWQNLFLALIGCFLGTVMGALPGLGPSNGVAILIPLAFTLGLPATQAMILLTSVYYGAMYGGRISSILLNIPGDEPALMTTLDGYPMARAGRAGEALAISGIASFVGAFLATWGLVFLAPQLVRVALLFGLRNAGRHRVAQSGQGGARRGARPRHSHGRRRWPDRRAALHLRRGASL